LEGFFIVHASAFQKVIEGLSADFKFRRGWIQANENKIDSEEETSGLYGLRPRPAVDPPSCTAATQGLCGSSVVSKDRAEAELF
jgi:hypothetical protein